MLPRIFIIGKNTGAYRTQNFINTVLKNQCAQLYFNGFTIKGIGIIAKIKYLLGDFGAAFRIFTSDMVYVCIMQHDNRQIKLAKRFKKKIITDYYVSLYDTYVNDRKLVEKGSKRAEEYRRPDRYALINSDVVLFLNSAEAEYYCRVVGVDLKEVNYKIVPLCNNVKKPVKLKYFRGEREYLSLCWTGTYIPLQGLDKVIYAMKILKEEGVYCKLNIWGNSDDSAKEYVEQIKNCEVEDMISIHNEWGNMDKWEEWMIENCDVNLGIFGDSEKAKVVVANKVVDGISFQAPVLTGESRGIDCYFNKKDDIYMVENTPEAIAKAVMKIKDLDIKEVERHTQNGYKIYMREFSERSFATRIRDLIGE